ncbi:MULTISPECIES: M3 family metallopeptidase [unclassified Pseudomonas]|uniref:M3 family metallopeptidase n=1 Tax=unclassified Pseudomonas TaxID=196821 RepID=UPI002AC99166|nr:MULTISPECIES: M3 family metallopeptidase [unclassified Pseudomonas]MEB0046054.1 M3 family metallopeptidase [Pseudomonas sp. Dout3]MEB0097314.1 M3 family metallopeptidase [Pseudomonas sp. DC1.2]WPX59063.1 M3 family metallopeptidase [Pseudomonas sp. DC1.2]
MPGNSNPFLQPWDLPPFSQVRAEHLVPAIAKIIADNRQAITDIIASQSLFPTWDDLVLAVDETDARLAEAMSVIEILDGVSHEDSAWNQASSACITAVTQYNADKMSNQVLYGLYQSLARSPIAANFDQTRQAVLSKVLREFRLSGIELAVEQQQTLARLNLDITRLESIFMTQLENANTDGSKHIDDGARLDGLSPASKDRLSLNAKQAGHGGWLLPLDQYTSFQVLTHAKDRKLREEYFVAHTTRASDKGPRAGKFDNGPILDLLLAERHRKALLLGYENYAQLTLQNRMADSTEQVVGFLKRQIQLAVADLERDAQAVKALATELKIDKVQPWDQAFLAEQLRQQRLGDLQSLRAYFPLDGTLNRLCLFSERLFAIRIVEQTVFSRWHDRVRLFEVSEHDQVIGHIYLDPYHRPQDSDFAWTATLRNRRMDAEGQVKLPIAVLNANLTPDVDDQPYLLTHQDLRMLFHEFGHCLHHVLTRSPHHTLSGISELGRDSAEFSGQFFELFCRSPEVLLWLAAHYQTGERLTEAHVDAALYAIQASTGWQHAVLLLEALFDFELHRCQGDGRSIQNVFEDVQQQIPSLNFPSYCRLANSFDYIVTGYQASVYAYKWSGVLAIEVFKKFKQHGVFNALTGRAFREIVLGPGDSRSLISSLEMFLERALKDDLFPAQAV